MPHLAPVSGVPGSEEPTSGAAVGAAPPADPASPTSPSPTSPSPTITNSSSTPPATSGAGAPATQSVTPPNAGAFGGTAAPTAGAPFPNQTFAWNYPPVTRRLNNLALASMIVSLASFITCPLLGLLGVYLGTRARSEIKAQSEDGDGMAIAGIVAGWVAAGVSVLLVVIYALFAGFFISMAARSGGV